MPKGCEPLSFGSTLGIAQAQSELLAFDVLDRQSSHASRALHVIDDVRKLPPSVSSTFPVCTIHAALEEKTVIAGEKALPYQKLATVALVFFF